MFNKIKKNWFTILIILQPIFDIIAFFQQNNIVGSLAGYSRLLVMVILPFCVLFKTKKKKQFFASMAVIGAYSFLHIANCFRVGYISPFQDIGYLARVIQMPVLALSFIFYFEDEDIDFTKVIPKAFYINCVIIFVTMVIAHLTGTADWTYGAFDVGLKGWFANSNAQSIIIVSLIPFVLQYVMKHHRLPSIAFTIIFTWFLLISNGTKVAYYAIFIIFGGFFVFLILEYLIKRKEEKKPSPIVLSLLILAIIASVVGYKYTPRYYVDSAAHSARTEETEQMDKDLEGVKNDNDKVLTLEEILSDPIRREEVINYYTPIIDEDLVAKFGTERVLYEYGYLPDPYQLADTRENKKMYARMIWKETDTLTKIVGFEYTNVVADAATHTAYDLENDYPAIFYYYGYLGFALYGMFLAYFVYRILKTVILDFKNAFNSFNFALLITYLVQLGAAELSGAILRRPNVSIYLSMILMLIYFQTADVFKNKGLTARKQMSKKER